jgi:preprotein translocase SecE subunit
MSLGIYKPGQGYWIRVLSAVLATLLIGTLSVWVYNQMLVLADRIPKSGYRVGLETVPTAPFKAGDAVEFTTRPDSTGKAENVATATVVSAERQLVVVDNFQLADVKHNPGSAGLVRHAGTTERGVLIPASQVVGIYPMEPILLGGIGVAVVLLFGAGIAYWFIAVKPSSVEFLIATDFEMTKVNWSTPREVMGHTWVVIGACFLLAASLWLVDQALVTVFTWMDLLPKVGQ